LKILVHDYAGHPFQVELSRTLANRGHNVLHLYSASTQTPRGKLTPQPDDAETFSIEGIDLKQVISKYRFVQRFQLEARYGKMLVDECERFQPDVVLSANTPSQSQVQLARWCRSRRARLVSWIQDCYGLAAYRILSKKLPVVGHLVGKYLMALDRESALASHAVIVISADFIRYFERNGVAPSRLHVIQNWAPLESLPVEPKCNAWTKTHRLDPQRARFLYSGTLSIRHDADLLVQLAAKLQEWGKAELVVVSEGPSVEAMKKRIEQSGLRCVRFFPYQPFEHLCQVLGSADVLVSILDRDAGVYCVPSKVLTYMCAGRAQLVAMPLENLAARIVKDNAIGRVSTPDDLSRFLENAHALLEDESLRSSYGDAARAFAEKHFRLEDICDRFEEIFVAGKTPAELAPVC
jgi:colanic acid biosynthesis glycosyl transferase WcaI